MNNNERARLEDELNQQYHQYRKQQDQWDNFLGQQNFYHNQLMAILYDLGQRGNENFRTIFEQSEADFNQSRHGIFQYSADLEQTYQKKRRIINQKINGES